MAEILEKRDLREKKRVGGNSSEALKTKQIEKWSI